MVLRPSQHRDTFARENLPPEDQWPVFEFSLPGLHIPDPFNCGAWLLDQALDQNASQKPAILQGDTVWSYAELAVQTNRLCHVLTDELGVAPGHRILLRGANSPIMFALWLAVMKVGAIAVSTMPMLRTRELQPIVEKAQIGLAICSADLTGDLETLLGVTPLRRIVSYGGSTGELERAMAGKTDRFAAISTSQDDVCLIAFTSGTTGQPKATMHFHRDVLAMCETFARHMVPAGPDAIFTGTPSIAFTFGLGGLLVFPLYFRSAIALPRTGTPTALAEAIERYRATHVFTSPTAYRAITAWKNEFDLSSLKVCVSAGEALSKTISDSWHAATGIRLTDGIGGTEMIHIFISAAGDEIRPGATGKPVPGYTAQLFDQNGRAVEGPGTGRLGIRGPTGCRYLSDARQRDYVVGGWNMTGDVYRRDEDGYYWFVARADDMIVSGGYNIAGPEVEAALLLHPDVEECAVIGWPDPERGQVVKAVVVPKQGAVPGPDLAKTLQEHVKQTLAPYKYPRAVEFCDALPKTVTGKLQRGALRPK
ncbi:MAG: AMP-binding protein [Alphaproteobacteria bacterium]|nr:AMP-binding protein [Alphaproteobacteria bacterium]